MVCTVYIATSKARRQREVVQHNDTNKKGIVSVEQCASVFEFPTLRVMWFMCVPACLPACPGRKARPGAGGTTAVSSEITDDGGRRGLISRGDVLAVSLPSPETKTAKRRSYQIGFL